MRSTHENRMKSCQHSKIEAADAIVWARVRAQLLYPHPPTLPYTHIRSNEYIQNPINRNRSVSHTLHRDGAESVLSSL